MLDGRTALVTGASAGLGRQFARTLAANGAAVVVCARRVDALNTLVAEISSAGGRALAHPLDVADASAIPRAFAAAEDAFGIVDILVNNAAIADGGFATKLTLETIDQVIDVDFRAPFLMSTEAARRLIAIGAPGRIVNISSVGAFHYTATSASALYCATKAGIIRMTQVLAIEWARYGINVNAIAPGMFESEMTQGFIEKVGDRVRGEFPRQRFGTPQKFDSTLLYLVDPASDFVTGTCITVDDAQTGR